MSMRSTKEHMIAWATTTLIVSSGLALRAAEMTFTGVVADAMCGATHKMSGPAESCTRECVKHGSDYALIMNDKAYTLKASNKLKAQLDKLAGQKAVVTGEQEGDTIQVATVKAAMEVRRR
jgi:hypothetical protein